MASEGIDRAEVDLFGGLPLKDWLNPSGFMRGLHEMNAIRIPFIEEYLQRTDTQSQPSPSKKSYRGRFARRRHLYRARYNSLDSGRIAKGLRVRRTQEEEENPKQTLSGLKILDVGAGAGILAQSLARRGANVVAMEPAKVLCQSAGSFFSNPEVVKSLSFPGSLSYVEATIQVNSLMARLSPTYQSGTHLSESDEWLPMLMSPLRDVIRFCLQPYKTTKLEMLSRASRPFDAVVLSEVIEHVPKGTVPDVLAKAREWCRPGGYVFITTPQKTLLSRLMVIGIAENILRIIPKGSHQYDKFVKPQTVLTTMEDSPCNDIKARLVAHEANIYLPGLGGRRGVFLPDIFPLGILHYFQAYQILN